MKRKEHCIKIDPMENWVVKLVYKVLECDRNMLKDQLKMLRAIKKKDHWTKDEIIDNEYWLDTIEKTLDFYKGD